MRAVWRQDPPRIRPSGLLQQLRKSSSRGGTSEPLVACRRSVGKPLGLPCGAYATTSTMIAVRGIEPEVRRQVKWRTRIDTMVFMLSQEMTQCAEYKLFQKNLKMCKFFANTLVHYIKVTNVAFFFTSGYSLKFLSFLHVLY